jgi:competence protein ComEC
MRNALVAAALALASCSRPAAPQADGSPDLALVEGTVAASVPDAGVGAKPAMTIHFYDVGQGLAALVDLPDGRHILVDTGDSPRRADCGDPCAVANRHLLERLNGDLRGAPIDLLWITHPHSDHLGGVPEVLEAFAVGTYADNGRDTGKAEVRRARRAAEDRGVAMRTVDPDHPDAPIASGPTVTITPVLPSKWPASCAHDANECSIALRIDFGASSVLFTGDAEHAEEVTLDPHGPVTLLQVGHHGSDTSTTPVFLARAKPKYAVISAGKPGEGLNREYCHPRAAIVRRLTRWIGGQASKTVLAFDGLRCDRATTADWIAEPASENLWVTARDGDVVLTTSGDGAFAPK